MSTKQPTIKFSPFEALLIGEKNKILKRQPMKNTIFVTRLNRQHKTVNLRDLFDLETDKSKPKQNDVFKMPQRVRDFLRTRRLKHKGGNIRTNKKQDILCYEFEGQKIIVKNNDLLKPKGKKAKLKSNKVKFKKKFNSNEKLKGMIAKKFCNCTKKINNCQGRSKRVLPRIVIKGVKEKRHNQNRHLLRGKDGKFIRKSDYEKLKSKEITPKQKYLLNYLHQLYLKKNKHFLHNEKVKRNLNFEDCEMSHNIKSILGLSSPEKCFDITGSESELNELSKMYFKNNCHEDFTFPAYPNCIDGSDFENDSYLIDIIFENFPKQIKFENGNFFDDFSDALKNEGILNPEKCFKMYEKKKNDTAKNPELTVIFDNHFPCIQLTRINNFNTNHVALKNIKRNFSSMIDEPCTKNSQLISAKSIRNLFFRSAEGKDIFIGNLVKPFLNNSWFGSLPQF